MDRTEPDEIESFLRLLIRRRVWFLSAFIIVGVVGVYRVAGSLPIHQMSFTLRAAECPSAGRLLALQDNLLQERVKIASAEFVRVLRDDAESGSVRGWSPDFSVNVDDALMRFSSPVTAANEDLVFRYQGEIILALRSFVLQERERVLIAIDAELASIVDEESELEALTERVESSESIYLRLQALYGKKARLEFEKASLQECSLGVVLFGPSVSEEPVGMSRTFKIGVTLFAALLLSTFTAIFVDYFDRARRPL